LAIVLSVLLLLAIVLSVLLLLAIVSSVLLLLAIVLSVLLRYADSDYPFGIFKLFLSPTLNHVILKGRIGIILYTRLAQIIHAKLR
jgi:hypothetical protein